MMKCYVLVLVLALSCMLENASCQSCESISDCDPGQCCVFASHLVGGLCVNLPKEGEICIPEYVKPYPPRFPPWTFPKYPKYPDRDFPINHSGECPPCAYGLYCNPKYIYGADDRVYYRYGTCEKPDYPEPWIDPIIVDDQPATTTN